MAKFFTADWHLDDCYAPGSHTFLRPKPTDVLLQEWLDECRRLIKSDDELYLLGDMVDYAQTLKVLDNLPDCRLFILRGNREQRIANFEEEVFKRLLARRNRTAVLGNNDQYVYDVEIGGLSWRVSHQPKNLLGFALAKPALCAHAHGTWRTQCLPNGEPVINVGIDAWGRLVTEELIQHEYRAIKQGYYDINTRADLWSKAQN